MRNIIKLFVIVILFNGIFLINQTSYAQTYGLEFKGQNVPLEERTGLDLTPNKLLKFKDEFEISFLAKGIQTKSELDLTGCVLQITGSNNNTINLLSILTPPEGLYIFLEKLNKSIPIAGSNESIYEWKKFTIKFLLKEDKLIFSYADSIYVQENVGFKRKDSFKIIFGLNNNSEVGITEVPPMAIKDIIIKEKGIIKYHWPLNENEGIFAFDSIKGKRAIVINPSWLASLSQNWQKVFEDEIDGPFKVTADIENGNIYMLGKEQFSVFSTTNNNVREIIYRNNPPLFNKNCHLFFNKTDKNIYCYIVDYELNDFLFVTLNINTGEWSKLEKQKILKAKKLTFYHHNSFYRAKDNSIYIFGGFGRETYHNQIYKFDFTDSIFTELPSNDSIFHPRYLSGSAELNDTVYIIGGYGSESGSRLMNAHSYFNLLGYSIKEGKLFEKFTIPEIAERMVFGNKIWINEKNRDYYGLIFSKIRSNNNHIQLIKGNIDSPDVQTMGNKFPFNFFDSRSIVNLYYMAGTNKLYAYIHNNHDSGKQVKIYSINYPPNMAKIESPGKVKNRDAGIFLIAILFILGVIGLVIFRMHKRNRLRKKIKNNSLKDKRSAPLAARLNTNLSQNGYNLIFFGGFQVFDKQMEDISNKFSPLLKELFLLIFLNTIKNGKGISTKKIIEILWSHKTEKSARNNLSVTNAKLRNLLNEIGEMELSKKTGYWKIHFNENEVKCDYLELLKVGSSSKRLDKQQIINFIDITLKGAFLINLEYGWLDEFKADVSEFIIDNLLEYGQSVKIEEDQELISQLADCVFNFDIVNDEAMIMKCKAQFHLHKHSLAKATFEKFCKQYEELYNEKYHSTFKEILG